MTPQEQRKIRLKNDFAQMKNIQGDLIDWRIIRGVEPFVEEYEVTIKIRSIVSDVPRYHNIFTMRVVLPDDYPFRSAPQINMVSTPYPFHPNWYTSGRWCYGTWIMTESLGSHIIRLIQTLQYDAEITNEHSAANSSANVFYSNNRNSGIFPCDTTILPDPTKEKFTVTNQTVRRKFDISGNGGDGDSSPPKKKFNIS